LLSELTIEEQYTDYRGHAEEICSKLNLDLFDMIVSCGGDGTMSEIVNGILSRTDGKRITIANLPGGTGNDLFRSLNGNSLKLEDGVQNILDGCSTTIDMGKVTFKRSQYARYFFTNLSWGLAAEAVKRSQSYKWMGSKAYELALGKMIFTGVRCPGKIKIDDKYELEGLFQCVSLFNSCYNGGGLLTAPLNQFNDGLIEILVVKDQSKCSLIKTLDASKKGMHVYKQSAECYRAKKFETLEGDYNVQIEGDVDERYVSPFVCEVGEGVIDVAISQNHYNRLAS